MHMQYNIPKHKQTSGSVYLNEIFSKHLSSIYLYLEINYFQFIWDEVQGKISYLRSLIHIAAEID